jgi:annexin A7/11
LYDFSNRALQDADALYKAGAGKIGTDEKTFNAIFAQRSYYQLRATFEEYQRVNYLEKD